MQTKKAHRTKEEKRRIIVLIEKIIIEVVLVLIIFALLAVIRNLKLERTEQKEVITVIGSEENINIKRNYENNRTKTAKKETNTAYKHPDIEFISLPVPITEELQRYIFETSEESGISYILVIALIEHESAFDPEIVSETNDTGLMQINAINAGEIEEVLGVTNLKGPEENIKAGIYLFSQLANKYEASEALMAYNRS